MAPCRLRSAASVSTRGPEHRAVQIRAAVEVAAPTKVEIVDGKMAKSLVVDRSYTYLDVRTPEEHKEEASLRKPAIVNVPIGLLTASGPALNQDFVPQVAAKFPNKAARILVACDDEMDRATLAAKKLLKEGYTSIRVLEGGYPEWQKVKPITEREKRG